MISNCNPTTIKNSDANHISTSSSLALEASADLFLLFNQFNDFSPEHENEPENVIQTDFVLDYFGKDWSNVLQLDQQDVNLPIESFLNNMNSILDDHAPLKRINNYKLKFKSKPAIQKSITVKNNLLRRSINAKDSQTKETFHKKYKDYRNMLSTLLKKTKQIITTNISKPI